MKTKIRIAALFIMSLLSLLFLVGYSNAADKKVEACGKFVNEFAGGIAEFRGGFSCLPEGQNGHINFGRVCWHVPQNQTCEFKVSAPNASAILGKHGDNAFRSTFKFTDGRGKYNLGTFTFTREGNWEYHD